MLDKLTVLEYEKPVADAYAEATRLLVENIAKHIASGRALNTAAWEVQKLKELGMLNRENAAIIRKVLLSVPDDVKYALSESAASAYRDMMDAVTYAEFHGGETRPPEEINRQIIEAWLQTATDKFNLTNTTMLQSAQQAYITAVNGVAQLAVDTLSDAQGKTVYGAFNASTASILSGGMTLDEAKKTVIGRMAAAGIYGFVDRAGRHWSPEAYASMVLRTTAHNVSVQATKAASQEFGVNVFQCSWHPNSRPTHYDYQGKFYSWDNSYGTFEDGLGVMHDYEPASNAGVDTAAGLFGINCGHEPIPMDEGVSVPFDPADIQPKELSDKGYAQAQEQRAKERAIRHAKMMANVYETAGDDKQAAEWRAKTREEQAALRRYLNETGRTRSRGREQIGGTAPTAASAQAPTKQKPTYTPAKTLEEAEAALRVITDTSQFGALGVSYQGISLEVANEINRTLIGLYNEYNVPKIGGIKAPAGNTKEGRLIDGAVAGYARIRNSFYLNRKVLKTFKTADKALNENDEAFRDILEHPEKYDFSKMTPRLQKMLDLFKQNGRSTVPRTVEEALTHEFGHSLERLLKNDERWETVKERWEEYAPKVSCYASTEISEYVAESFASYRKGERVTDPVLIEMFERLKR